MPRFFTRDQAHGLLPAVERSMRAALDLKAAMQEAEQELRAFKMHIMVSGGSQMDPVRTGSAKQRRDGAALRLKEELDNLQERGCLVKDLDVGLVDFPTLYRGVEVYLCWKFGEPEIAFWHAVSDGFRGRKPIDAEFLSNHCGDSE
jgi:hypothetical protein